LAHGVTLYWAGADRRFALDLGGILDLEEACGRIGIGELFVAISSHKYTLNMVRHTLRIALVGGGMPQKEAERLINDRLLEGGIIGGHAVAVEVILSVMEGVQPDALAGPAKPVPLDAGEVFAAFVKVGITPQQVREMRYADFANLTKALGRGVVQPPTEEEFNDMVSRLAPEAKPKRK
jgi:hypothetical protein